MTELINKLYYMVEDWVGQSDLRDEKIKNLEARQEDLQEEIILRLGEDGREMMETLSNLNLELETIHDEALFRAAMQLGTEIAAPGAGRGPQMGPVIEPRAAAKSGGHASRGHAPEGL